MIRTLALLALLPGAALAQCPTAADLETGIRFQVDENDIEIFTNLTEDVVQSDFWAGGEPMEGSVSQYSRTGYLLQFVSREGGEIKPEWRTTYAFPYAPGDLPVLQPGDSFQWDVMMRNQDGLMKENHLFEVQAPVQRTYGNCTYEVIPYSVTYVDGSDKPNKDTMDYLPGLGVTLWVETTWDGTTDVMEYKLLEGGQ
ncbi:hypothetical protein [Tropicibacter naphthalenivorans]|uniref:Uncharacterized protein n=1 Tax=Tropicibacter naphthalenivorans TaxID=441103 RepID=A0A0P1G156_9RHOB|nr:hypothetical protein [Tropicibacter naphthalenivorans]CUH75331.1 hypothetical protein TRN7648_00384 [Tropicibacter naphthalenivorans]SMC45054.1 hypothetical protein SAMN04488093_101495 [Tropicibacter naphthalenivorans]